MTDKSTIQSWPREQLESAFTQREWQLGEAMKENAELKAQLAQAGSGRIQTMNTETKITGLEEPARCIRTIHIDFHGSAPLHRH